MKTLSTAATRAADRRYAEPTYLLQIDFTVPSAKTLRFSDRYASAMGQEWLPYVVDWGTFNDALNTLDVDGRPATATLGLLNTKPIEGRSRLSDLISTPGNLSNSYEWAYAKATLYQLFSGLALGDQITLGVFYLEDPREIGEDILQIRMSDYSLVLEDKLRVTRVSRELFPTCGKDHIGQSIPRPFGVLTNVPTIPIVDGYANTLNGALTAATTTVVLNDATDFPTSGTGQCGLEQMSWTGKSGNSLTTVTRGVNSTSAVTHSDGDVFFQVKSGTNAYRYVVAEVESGFPAQAVSNIRVNGHPARTSPTVQLEETGIVTDKRFVTISFTPSSVKNFHTIPLQADLAANNIPNTINIVALNGDQNYTMTPAFSALTGAEFFLGRVQRHAKTTFTNIGGGGGAANLYRFDPYTGAKIKINGWSPSVADTQTVTFETGDSLAAETWQLEITGTTNLTADWTIEFYTATGSASQRHGTGSTADIVIGDVTCDISGIKDNTAGAISGVPNQLLQNPADVTRFILTQLYGIASGDLGGTWTTTAGQLAIAGTTWAMLLEYQLFSQLRRRLGEQARSALYLEGGRWEYHYLPDHPVAQRTLDYLTDVWSEMPARVTRSARAEVRNSLSVSAQRDYTTTTYRYLKVHEDLTSVPVAQTADLVLDLVQDEDTADALGDYWLTAWRRQRLSVELVTWWNALAMEKIDYIAIANHPILETHGGTALVFRIVEKHYLLGDENPGRIRLRLIEANG